MPPSNSIDKPHLEIGRSYPRSSPREYDPLDNPLSLAQPVNKLRGLFMEFYWYGILTVMAWGSSEAQVRLRVRDPHQCYSAKPRLLRRSPFYPIPTVLVVAQVKSPTLFSATPQQRLMGCYIHTAKPQLNKFWVKTVFYVFYKTGSLIKTERKMLEAEA